MPESIHRPKPCKGCPFSRGPKAVRCLRPDRLGEIVESQGGFVCHEDVHGNGKHRSNPRQCAGFYIYHLVNETAPQMMRIEGRLGMIDVDELLKHADEVITDFDELVETHDG